MADAVIKGRSIHPLRARLVRRNSLVWVPLRSMSPRVACRRHRYRLAIGVKEKAKKPGADGDGYGADEQKCAIYQRKHSAGKHRNIDPGIIKRNSTYRHMRKRGFASVPESPRAAFLRLRVGLGDFADFCEMVWNKIPRLLRVAISLIYEAAILKLISIFLGL